MGRHERPDDKRPRAGFRMGNSGTDSGAAAGSLALLFAYLRTEAALAMTLVIGVLLMCAVVFLERAPYEKQIAKHTASV